MRDLIVRGVRAGTMRSDAQLRASLAETLREASEDVWIFAYGSLMWNPPFAVAERRIVRVSGYHRSFCLRSTLGRSSVESPGLMLALDAGGATVGVALRMARDGFEGELALLWRRGMSTGSYVAKWLRAQDELGEIQVLAFVANRRAANYVGGLPDDETVRLLATGVGFLGTNLDYLVRTHSRLTDHGINDPKVKRLMRLCSRRDSLACGVTSYAQRHVGPLHVNRRMVARAVVSCLSCDCDHPPTTSR